MQIPNKNQDYVDITKIVNHPQSKFMKEIMEFTDIALYVIKDE